ncbi:unnamed protein product, partial [Ectocarpus fasciculatus]
MFRSLFGTTVAGEYGDAGTTGGRAGTSSEQEQAARKGTPGKTAPGGASSSAQDGGGFFQLEPTHASAEESLFDDLEVKPPAVEPKPSPMKPPADSESAAGVFSAFQFMAEPAAAPSDTSAPIGDSSPSAGGGGQGMSAFSFLTDESPAAAAAAGDVVEGQDAAVNIPGEAAGKTTPSSFSFLSEGGGGGPAAESSVAAEAASAALSSSPLAATAKVVLPASSGDTGKAAAEVGAAAGQTPGDVDQQQPAGSASLASEVSSSSTTAGGGLGATGAQEGADKTPAADGVPASWKPSAGVVRKKRTVRRVGYAREETVASSSMAPPAPLQSPAAGRQAGGGNSSTEAAGDQTSGSRPSDTAGGDLSRGAGGGHYEAPSVPIPSRKASSSSPPPMGVGREAMDDSMVAEAAAMAALAASMAPSEIQEAMAKGDLKQGSSHGTASSSTSSAAGGGAAAAAAAAAASLSHPHPTAMKKNHSFITKFKGLLSQSSSSKSDCSPLSPLAAARKSATSSAVATTPRSFPKDAAATATATAKEGEGVPSSRSERGVTDPDSAAEGGSSIIRPASSEGEESGAVQ